MSAGGRASVFITDAAKTRALASAFAKGRRVPATSSLTLIVNGVRVDGWTFFSKDSNGVHDIFLRHALDDELGTAEYAHLALPRDGKRVQVTQAIVIQNDNDYKGRGNDRFGVLRPT